MDGTLSCYTIVKSISSDSYRSLGPDQTQSASGESLNQSELDVAVFRRVSGRSMTSGNSSSLARCLDV